MSDALTPAEIEVLMSTVAENAPESNAATTGAVSYSFKRPNRVSQEQIRSLHSLHEGLARNLEFRFSTLVRQLTDVSIVSVMQLTYEEFLQSMASPACICLLSDKELKSNIALDIGLDTVFPMIDRILGGRGVRGTVRREPTELEWSIVRRVAEAFLDEYNKMWRPVRELNVTFRAHESNPHQAQIVGPNEVVVLVVMKIEFGDVSGMLTVCFPFVSLEPLLQKLNLRTWLLGEGQNAGDESAAWMRSHIGRVRLQIGANLGTTRVPVRALLDLKEGDVLRLDVSVEDEIAIVVNGLKKLTARPVSRSGTKAVRITGVGQDGS